MLSAVVLAAGESTRMGAPKALLRAPDGRSFITRVVDAFVAAGVPVVTVVTGSHHDRIVEALTREAPELMPCFARNPDPARGQLSSLWVGMDAAIAVDTEGLLVTLVDVPMLHATTISAVIAAWQRTRAPIVRPALGERHGHPVLFDRALFQELRAAPLDAGAKTVVRRHADRIVNVAVEDEGCLVDIDTPADYAALRGRHSGPASGGRGP
jgi:molybdenum cofactor cytidylyltransferase